MNIFLLISIISLSLIIGMLIFNFFDQHSKKKETINQSLILLFIQKLECAETLEEVFNLHKDMWTKGIQHQNFGPDPYGMFRTKDISSMTKDEVFLGNIYGLFTKPLSFWAETPDTKEYKIVLNQYKYHLISNLKALYEQV